MKSRLNSLWLTRKELGFLCGIVMLFSSLMGVNHMSEKNRELEQQLKVKEEVYKHKQQIREQELTTIMDSLNVLEERLEEVNQVLMDKEKVLAEKEDELLALKEKEETLKAENDRLFSLLRDKEEEERKQSLVASSSVASVQPARGTSITNGEGASRSTVKSGQVLTVTATAYTADCVGCSGITATGIDVRNKTPNIIAVDPNVIPLGSSVEIIHNGKSLGVYSAQDKGSAIKGNKIDILMATKQECYDWGRRTVEIRIL